MTRFPDPGRLSAHVLLDSVVSYDDKADLDTNTAAANLAFERLTEIDGAYVVHVAGTDDNVQVHLDLSNLLGASLITIAWLVKHLSEAGGESREAIIADVRKYLDS